MTKKVEVFSEKDPDSLYHKREIRVGKIKIETPIKAIDLSKVIKYRLPDKIRGLNYIYRKIGDIQRKGQTWIDNIKYNPKKEGVFTYKNNTLLNKSNENDINLFFLEYEGLNYPTDEDLRVITNKIHKNSTITPLPIISDLRKRINEGKQNAFQKYMGFVDECFNEISNLNYNPIMGMVPILTPTYTEKLVDYYLDKGVNAFCVDFDGRTPSSTSDNITAMLKIIKNYDGDLDDIFITSINLSVGRAGKKADVIFAKDILSYGYGIDSFGEKHKKLSFKPKPPKPQSSSIIEEQEINKLRLFNKEDYGYYKLGASALEKIYPKDSIIPLDILKNSFMKSKKDTELQNIFNIEQQGLEALNIRELIADQEITKYIEGKKFVKEEDLKKMKRVQANLIKGGTQLGLFDF